MPKMAVYKVAFWTLRETKQRNGPNKIMWTENQKDCITWLWILWMYLVTSSRKAGVLYEFESAVFVRDCYQYRQVQAYNWGGRGKGEVPQAERLRGGEVPPLKIWSKVGVAKFPQLLKLEKNCTGLICAFCSQWTQYTQVLPSLSTAHPYPYKKL